MDENTYTSFITTGLFETVNIECDLEPSFQAATQRIQKRLKMMKKGHKDKQDQLPFYRLILLDLSRHLDLNQAGQMVQNMIGTITSAQ